MAKTIKFKKEHNINGITYKKGDVVIVSTSIFESLTKDGVAGEFKPKKAATKKASGKKTGTK